MCCDKCGAQIADTANFCNKCGNVIKKQNTEKKQLQEVNAEQVTSEKKGGLWKKVIPAVGGLVIIVLCAIMWMSGSANSSNLEYSYDESNKTATVIGFKNEKSEEEETELSIPAEVMKGLTKYKVTAIGESAFNDCEALKSVIIKDGVTSIGKSAFAGCTSLTSVTIPNSVTSIEKCAFEYCIKLSNLVIPNGVTKIGAYAFNNCGLTSITIPNSVTSIEQFAFHGCDDLTSITIPGNVVSIGKLAFGYCDNLTSVTISDGVTSIGPMAFFECPKLTSVRLPNTLKKAGYSLFAECPLLLGVSMPSNVEFESDVDEYKSWKFDNYEEVKNCILWGIRP